MSILEELPIDNRSIPELGELVEVLSGYRTYITGIPLTPEELQNIWERVRAEHPTNFTSSSEDIINWYLHEADASERVEQWSAAAFHLSYLAAAKPDNQTYRDRLNRARELANRTNALPNP